MSTDQQPDPIRSWWETLPREGATAIAWTKAPAMSNTKEAKQIAPIIVGELQTRKGSR